MSISVRPENVHQRPPPGGIGRADPGTNGRLVRDDPGHGIAATVVVAQHLTEKSPDSRDRIENSIPILDAMVVEDIEDVGFGQNIRKGKPLVARKTGANFLQARH